MRASFFTLIEEGNGVPFDEELINVEVVNKPSPGSVAPSRTQVRVVAGGRS
jgi:hypothetical protein